jgi:hypothetical protein
MPAMYTHSGTYSTVQYCTAEQSISRKILRYIYIAAVLLSSVYKYFIHLYAVKVNLHQRRGRMSGIYYLLLIERIEAMKNAFEAGTE